MAVSDAEIELRVAQLVDADNINTATIAALAAEFQIQPTDLLRRVPPIVRGTFDAEIIFLQFATGGLTPLQRDDFAENLIVGTITVRDITERLPETVDDLASEISALHEELSGFIEFITPASLDLEGLLEKLSQLLLFPQRMAGEPCLAPAPLLRDLLDLVLGKVFGGIGATVAKVVQKVEDFLFPAFAQGEDLARFIQAVLDDPITAALNLILGQRNKIDCVVEGGLGVGAQVIEFGIERIEDALEGILA